MRAPPRTSSRATSRGRAHGERAAADDHARVCRPRPRRLPARGPAASRRDDAADRAPADHLPRGLHATGDGRESRSRPRDRDRQARSHAPAHRHGIRGGERARAAAAGISEELGWSLDRGLPVPVDVRVQPVHPSAELVRDQLEAFAREWRKVDLRYARSKNLTPYDVLIIASMIEKETVAPEERRLVAAVIYNRLRLDIALGIDATIRYGRNVPGTEPLKQSDLDRDDPYNTRLRLGLPPTPIANPGSRRCVRPRIPPVSVTSTSCASPTGCTTSSRRARPSSTARAASTASAADAQAAGVRCWRHHRELNPPHSGDTLSDAEYRARP